MKSVVKRNAIYFLWELEQAITDFAAYCNHKRLAGCAYSGAIIKQQISTPAA